MIIFRQKSFGKNSLTPKEAGNKLIKAVKNNPLTAVNTLLSTTSIGIALKRSKNEKKFQKDQVNATEKLTEAIEKSNNSELKRSRNKKLIKRSQKPYTRDYYLPKPVEDLQSKTIDKINKKRNHDSI